MSGNGSSLNHWRDAYLLWQLFQARAESEAGTLSKGPANRAVSSVKGVWLPLEFAAAKARHAPTTPINAARASLVPEYVTAEKSGRSEVYAITEAGVRRLRSLRQHPDIDLKAKGRTLNGLLDLPAASTASAPARSADAASADTASADAGPVADDAATVGDDEIRHAVLRHAQALVRDRYSRRGSAPVHEVRAAVARELGAAAASHDRFDPILWRLHDDRAVGLVALTDETLATEQQLADSLTTIDSHKFYIRL